MKNINVPVLFKFNRRLALQRMSGAAFLAGASPLLRSQSLQPVRIIVGAPTGGSTDTIARTMAQELGRLLQRTVVVENRPGAGGNIAADFVAKSQADGTTLLLSFTSHAINASLYPSLPFDPIKDFTPLTCVATSPSILVANPKLPVKDVRELIALAKQKPGQLNFALGAVGSSLHLAGDAFKQQSGVFIVNIPYRGTAPAIADVVAGHVDLMFAAVGNAQALVKAGKLRALGVTSPQRLAAFPDIAPIADVLPGYSSSAWFGLFAPGAMQTDLTRKISDAARQAATSLQVKARLENEGMQAIGNDPEEFARFVQSEIKRLASVVKYSGAKPE